jgi:hypothetical protein
MTVALPHGGMEAWRGVAEGGGGTGSQLAGWVPLHCSPTAGSAAPLQPTALHGTARHCASVSVQGRSGSVLWLAGAASCIGGVAGPPELTSTPLVPG